MSSFRTPCRLDKLLSHTTGGVATGYTYDAARRPVSVQVSRLSTRLLYWSCESEMSSAVFITGRPPFPSNGFTYNGLSTRVAARNTSYVWNAFVRDGAGVTTAVVKDTDDGFDLPGCIHGVDGPDPVESRVQGR